MLKRTSTTGSRSEGQKGCNQPFEALDRSKSHQSTKLALLRASVGQMLDYRGGLCQYQSYVIQLISLLERSLLTACVALIDWLDGMAIDVL